MTFGYFSSQKSNPPPGRRAVYAFAKGSAPPTGEMILWHDLCHQSLRFAPCTIASLYTMEAMVRCSPLAQGSLRGGAVPAGGKNEGKSENSPLTGRGGFGMIVK